MCDHQENANKELSETENTQNKKIGELHDYTYCMVSTLNQMVNYLPMLLFPEMTKKLYITLKEDGKQGRGPNKSFDEAIKSTCSEASIAFPIESEWLKLNSPYSTSAVKDAIISKISGSDKIFWNITGGQRPILMAIIELAKTREGDYICYLEGNEGKLVIQQSDGKGEFAEVNLSHDQSNHYAVPNEKLNKLTIPIALKLMGFEDTKAIETVNKKKGSKGEEEEIVKYEKFVPGDSKAHLDLVEEYIKQENEVLRLKLLALNKKLDKEEQHLPFQEAKKENGKIVKNPDGSPEMVTKYVRSKQTEGNGILHDRGILFDTPEITPIAEGYFTAEQLKLLRKHKRHPYPFGHLLEELFAHRIWSVAKDHIAEMAVNVRLYYDDEQKHQQAEGKNVDELDIVVLTKTGQLVVFEVKSGDMSGDVAKSTKYTTYAIAGVYGKPVLLTPLLKSQLSDLGKLSKDWAYDASASAARAARRAQLPVLALDGNENKNGDFESALKAILNIK